MLPPSRPWHCTWFVRLLPRSGACSTPPPARSNATSAWGLWWSAWLCNVANVDGTTPDFSEDVPAPPLAGRLPLRATPCLHFLGLLPPWTYVLRPGRVGLQLPAMPLHWDCGLARKGASEPKKTGRRPNLAMFCTQAASLYTSASAQGLPCTARPPAARGSIFQPALDYRV